MRSSALCGCQEKAYKIVTLYYSFQICINSMNTISSQLYSIQYCTFSLRMFKMCMEPALGQQHKYKRTALCFCYLMDAALMLPHQQHNTVNSEPHKLCSQWKT